MTRARLEAKLGFDKVREQIQNKCQTEYAAQRVAEEEFCTNEAEIRQRLALTDEMRLVLMFEDNFPTTGYVDTIPFLEALQKEGSCIDLVNIGKLGTLIELIRRTNSFFYSIKDGVYPLLKRNAARLGSFPDIRHRIEEILDRYGQIKDSASEELFHIRTELRGKEASIAKRVAAILKKAQNDGLADSDAQVSIRDGKFLIPINSSSKRKIQGFVFDLSASGKTCYIEPAEVIDIENEIADLQFREKQEIAKILFSFSEFIRPALPKLISAATELGEMDFLMAKAQTALDYVAGMPVISNCGELHLRKARHPLLEQSLKKEGRKICPLSVNLTPEKRILMISGPNAGGKSVCLKTVGLLQYMFQWGMLVPTSESSELPIFQDIMLCIGDDQSLENDLSTYSSFLLDMKAMLEKCNDKSLLLIDEFGSGTEPAAGGAIAEALLSEFDNRLCYGVITTHYTRLKLYATGAQTHVINGAMLFDSNKIAPLFELQIGMPGNSFAFELARKTGLPESIVKDAEQRAGEEFVDIEKNLRRIARGRRVLDEKIRKVKHADKNLEAVTERYEQELQNIQEQKKQIIEEARKEAAEIVKGAGRQVEQTIKTIRESQADKSKTKAARSELQGFIQALEESKAKQQQDHDEYINRKLNQLQKRKKKSEATTSKKDEQWQNAPLKIGEKVRVKANGMVGEVVMVSAKEVKVVIGSISSKLSPDKLERISANEYKQAAKKSFSPVYEKVDPAISARKLNFKPEIDIRGERLSDALDIVSHYIDDAIMLGVSPVRIIHGKGSGVLHEELQKYLRTVPGVKEVKDEDIRQGGSGVSIVALE